MKYSTSKIREIIREEVRTVLNEETDISTIFDDSIEGLIKEYFYRSMAGDWDDPYFWDQIVMELKGPFRNKSVEHGFLGVDAYAQWMKDIGLGPELVPTELTLFTDWIQVGNDEIFKAIMEKHVEELQNVFGGGIHKDIYNIYRDLERFDQLDLKNKINLINRAIHAEHETGDVIELYKDPDELRAEAEKEYEQRNKSKVANVRNNPNFI